MHADRQLSAESMGHSRQVDTEAIAPALVATGYLGQGVAEPLVPAVPICNSVTRDAVTDMLPIFPSVIHCSTHRPDRVSFYGPPESGITPTNF